MNDSDARGELRCRVALVRPPAFQILRSLSYFGAIPPIGLAYIAATLRGAGHVVTVVDAVGEAPEVLLPVDAAVRSLYRHGLSPAQVVDRLPLDTQLVGITHMFLHEWPAVRELATLARARLPAARIVIGGENATAFWRRILAECPAVDACVLGEGESVALELAARAATGETFAGMPGLAVRDADPDAAKLAPRLTKLGDVPRPAWDLFPMEAYFRGANTFGVHRGRTMPILSTRGCPFQCTFCSSPSMWTTRYVTRPPQDVVDEIAAYVERYQIDNVDFCDLTAIVKRSWILEFCDRLRASGLRVSWQLPVGTRSEALDREVLQGIYDTGCRNITYAPESGSERLLKAMKKQVRLPKLRESLRAALDVGLIIRLNFILGHPRETRADAWQTWKLLMATAWMGCQDASVMVFSPYPGSADYDALKAAGKLADDGEDCYLALARSGRSSHTFNDAMGRTELLVLQLLMLVSFYVVACVRSPLRLPQLAWSLVTGQERSHVEQLFRTKAGLVRQIRDTGSPLPAAGERREPGPALGGADVAAAPPPT